MLTLHLGWVRNLEYGSYGRLEIRTMTDWVNADDLMLKMFEDGFTPDEILDAGAGMLIHAVNGKRVVNHDLIQSAANALCAYMAAVYPEASEEDMTAVLLLTGTDTFLLRVLSGTHEKSVAIPKVAKDWIKDCSRHDYTPVSVLSAILQIKDFGS